MYSNYYHRDAPPGRLRDRRAAAGSGLPRPQAVRLSGVFVAGRATAAEQTTAADQLSGSGGKHRDFEKFGVHWLARRKLLAVGKESVTATPQYSVLTPWRRPPSRKARD